MIILKIIGWILYIVLKMVIGVIQIVLTFLATCISFGGRVFQLAGGLIGTLFVMGSLIGLPMGIVSGKEFWQMFFLGIAFGAIPAFLASVGRDRIYAVKGVLNKI